MRFNILKLHIAVRYKSKHKPCQTVTAWTVASKKNRHARTA